MIEIKARRLNALESIIGLIGKPVITPVFFITSFGIHTFGVRFPIDVVILDQNNRVVKIKKNLLPNRLFFWNPKYSKVLELPSQTIDNKFIKLGNKINLIS